MPKMNGKEAVLTIRGLGFLGKIYGCTGNTSNDEVDSFIANGADRVFMKPLDDKSFRSILKGIVIASLCEYLSLICTLLDLADFKVLQSPTRSREPSMSMR